MQSIMHATNKFFFFLNALGLMVRYFFGGICDVLTSNRLSIKEQKAKRATKTKRKTNKIDKIK